MSEGPRLRPMLETRASHAPRHEAGRVLKAPDWSPAWWDREEELAEDATSPFESKFRLFAAGRWPLGVVGSTLVVF